MGNIVEVDLEKNSQSAQPVLTLKGGGKQIGAKTQAPADSVSCKGEKWCVKQPLRILSNCAHIMQSIPSITYRDTKYDNYTIDCNNQGGITLLMCMFLVVF